MKNKIILIAFAVVAAGTLLLMSAGRSFISEVTQEVRIEPNVSKSAALGKPTPYFELADLEGKKIKLTDLFGKPLVIIFWTTWSTDSTSQIKLLDDYLSQNREPLFEVVAVSSQEDRSIVAQFISRGGYEVKVLLDEDGSITDAYGARSLPMSFFIDKEGILRDILVGTVSGKALEEHALYISQ